MLLGTCTSLLKVEESKQKEVFFEEFWKNRT